MDQLFIFGTGFFMFGAASLLGTQVINGILAFAMLILGLSFIVGSILCFGLFAICIFMQWL
jgi:hypothetical protein